MLVFMSTGITTHWESSVKLLDGSDHSHDAAVGTTLLQRSTNFRGELAHPYGEQLAERVTEILDSEQDLSVFKTCSSEKSNTATHLGRSPHEEASTK